MPSIKDIYDFLNSRTAITSVVLMYWKAGEQSSGAEGNPTTCGSSLSW